jgi:hypothetical protein
MEIPNHVCFLNWNKGATSIEADGIADGFKKSIELHGVKFSKLIGNNIKYNPSLPIKYE